ncbi:formylmethionine deformylase [Metamycoplasma cloacale]|uniref:Peptide deformylase n=1 Tax=Metamycoplasma cloacale TaxID=92401 RepID=A0A2Z4LLE5_9BACT|nr:peptide deformylase [Metamycoplasma cloacale]AWX42516.1 peptide deformylase [Metamycoplasma cloacale]VEU79138.1 formylmethionine deformylase [Metamycoplasma cloacale]
MFKYEDVTLVQLPKPILRQKSAPVPIPLTEEDDLLIQKMIFHVDDSQKPDTKFRPAVGVAAIQYGIPKQIFYILITNDKNEVIFRDAVVNPKMLAHSDIKLALEEGEGCLSVNENDPNQEGYVPRYARVVLEGYSYFEKKVKKYDVSGYTAIVFQHEYDHLQGNLFIDHINQKDPWKLPKNTKVL